MKKNNEKGLVLLAGFHSTYANYALGLISTIRNKDKEIPILLYITEGLLSDSKMRALQNTLNVEVKVLDPEHYTVDGDIRFVKAKTRLYELSPFKKTIFLDVDMIFFPRKTLSQLFESLDGKEFSIISEGHFDIKQNQELPNGFYTYWGDRDTILEKYPEIKKQGRLNKLRSEFLYFEKSPKIKKLFTLVKQVYDNPLTRSIKIGEALPDEYAFNIATSILGYQFDAWSPIYWEYKRQVMNKPIESEFVLFNNYYAFSVGGNVTVDWQKSIYNRHISGSMGNLGLSHLVFKLNDKMNIAALNRQKL